MAAFLYEQWVARGRAHQGEGRPIDAMLCYRRAMRADARAPQAPFHLGEVLWQLGRLADAIGTWRAALASNPGALGPAQALEEALLVTGDHAGAASAAAHVLRLAPTDVRAEGIAGITAMLDPTGDSAAAVARVAAAIAKDPTLVIVPSLSAPLALALDRIDDAEARTALFRQIASALHTLPQPVDIPPTLLSVLCERAAEPGSDLAASRALWFAAARTRDYRADDHDALRRIAHAAFRSESTEARALAGIYANLCAGAFATPFAAVWPRRTSGRMRVIALVDRTPSPVAVDALALLARAHGDDCDVAVAVLGGDTLSRATTEGAGLARLRMIALPPAPDANDAKRLGAFDADVLIDLAGLCAASGPLLARRPARLVATPANLGAGNVLPLVDRVVPTLGELANLLGGMRIDFPPPGIMPDAAAMTAQWESAIREHQQGELVAARERYASVLALQPEHAPAHYLLGVVLRDGGETEGARAEFANALALAPGFVDARIAVAKAMQSAGDVEAAVALLAEGLAQAPQPLPLLRALGLALLAKHDGAGAADAFAHALAIEPTDGETHFNRGVAFQMVHRTADAAREYQHALAFRPDLVAADFNLGAVFRERGAVDAAVLAYENVLKAEPANVAAHRNLCEVLQGAARVDTWLASFRRFEAKCPDALAVAVQGLEACQHRGDFAGVDRYLDGLRQERFGATDAVELCDNLEQLLYLLLFFDIEPEVIFRFAQTYDATARSVYGAPLGRPAARRPGRIRIGYLSADLSNHVMGKMMWQAVQHHDRDRFSLHFYSLSNARDAWTERFAGIAERFTVLADLGEREAARRIVDDDLDLLVDLSTHTRGAKPGILALKPARVQMTHVASAGTVGLSTVDFKLTDQRADLAESQQYQSEVLLAMDGCVYPYRHIAPATTHPFHRGALGVPAEAVLIGAFVAPLKLSRRCLGLWREVLARVPRARLVFSPTDAAFRDSYARLAAAAGIASDRLLFLPQGRDDAENQARYELIDFVLDPLPFGGVNGTLEALDMGVPVVTLVGQRHGERTSFSILASLGVTQTVAQGGREYVDLAARLADDRAFAEDVRAAIRKGLLGSALTDMPAHTRNLEAAYLAALRQKAPDALRDAEPDG